MKLRRKLKAYKVSLSNCFVLPTLAVLTMVNIIVLIAYKSGDTFINVPNSSVSET